VLDRGEDAGVEGGPVGDLPRDGDGAPAGREGGQRVATDERPAAPPLAVLDGLEQEPGLVAHQAGEGGDGRGEVGQDLPPNGDDGVLTGEGPELVAAGTEGHPKAR